jgi:zinc transporter, ZIP family
MLTAFGWGCLAASSLVLGAVLAFARPWSSRQVGGVLAFGAGALISAVSFELWEEAHRSAVSAGPASASRSARSPISAATWHCSAAPAAAENRAPAAHWRSVLWLWLGVASACALSTALGFGVADAASGGLQGAVNGFAAGALLVMLIDSMIPAASEDAGRAAGLITARLLRWRRSSPRSPEWWPAPPLKEILS